MAVSDRLHSHAYSMCSPCIFKSGLIPIETAQARTKGDGHDPRNCQYHELSPSAVQYEMGNNAQLC